MKNQQYLKLNFGGMKYFFIYGQWWHCDGIFNWMAVDEDGQVGTSTDGSAWTARGTVAGATDDELKVLNVTDKWIIIKSRLWDFGGAYTSTDDGDTWTVGPEPSVVVGHLVTLRPIELALSGVRRQDRHGDISRR